MLMRSSEPLVIFQPTCRCEYAFPWYARDSPKQYLQHRRRNCSLRSTRLEGHSVIYREMPPLWDRAFRARFYTHWGRESAVISATTRRVEYPDYTQLLSIKMMSGGSEDYFVDGRRICVDDDTYLILNAGRRYASRIDAMHPAHSFSVFFRPGLAEEVRDSVLRSTESLLADPAGGHRDSIEFDERLREHDRTVTPVLRHIRQAVDAAHGQQHARHERLAVDRVMADCQRLADVSEQHLLMGHEPRQANRVDRHLAVLGRRLTH